MKISTIKKNLEQKNQEIQFIKKVPAHPRLQLKRKIMLKNLQIKKEKEKNKPEVEWIRTIIENKIQNLKKRTISQSFRNQIQMYNILKQ